MTMSRRHWAAVATTFMYEEGFKWWNLGNASAVAFLLFLLIFAVTLVQMRVARRAPGWQ